MVYNDVNMIHIIYMKGSVGMAKRLQVTLSDEMQEWVELESAKMGVSQSSIIVLGLKTYIDQQKAMSVMHDVKALVDEVNRCEVDFKEMLKECFKGAGYKLDYDENGKPVVSDLDCCGTI